MSLLTKCCCVSQETWFLVQMCDCYEPGTRCEEFQGEPWFRGAVQFRCDYAEPSCRQFEIGDVVNVTFPEFGGTRCCFTIIDIQNERYDLFPEVPVALVEEVASCTEPPCCPEEPNICCFEDGSCVMLIPDECLAQGGIPGPPPPESCSTYECPTCWKIAELCSCSDDPGYAVSVRCQGVPPGVNIFKTQPGDACWFVSDTSNEAIDCDPSTGQRCLDAVTPDYPSCEECCPPENVCDECVNCPPPARLLVPMITFGEQQEGRDSCENPCATGGGVHLTNECCDGEDCSWDGCGGQSGDFYCWNWCRNDPNFPLGEERHCNAHECSQTVPKCDPDPPNDATIWCVRYVAIECDRGSNTFKAALSVPVSNVQSDCNFEYEKLAGACTQGAYELTRYFDESICHGCGFPIVSEDLVVA